MQMKKNNQKQKATETKLIMKWSPQHLYFQVEEWLTEMSLQGWHLVARDGIAYTFEKGDPQYKEYFIWELGYTRESRKYDIPYQYPCLEKTFGVSLKKSKLNKYSKEKCGLAIEIDLDKINNDPELKVAYQELKLYRNRMYRKRALGYWLGILTFILLFFLMTILLATGVIPSTFQPSWA